MLALPIGGWDDTILLSLRLIAVLFLVAQSASLALAAAEPMKDCEVLARVNGQVILTCELSWEVDLMIKQRFAQLPPEQVAAAPPEALEKLRTQLTQQLLMSRLDMALFYADFRATVPQANLSEIHKSLEPQFEKSELKTLMKRLDAKDRADLEAKLFELGTTIAERREDFYKKMISRSWLTETVKFDREVTHEDMLVYYEEHQAEYAYPTQAKWEELMILFSRFNTKQEAYAEIAKLGNQVFQSTQGLPPNKAAFEQIAKTSSDGFTSANGGQHKWTTKGAMSTESIDKALFSTPVGQMSPILEGPLGFHIVRVLERKEAGKTPFRELQNDIRNKVRDERFNEAVNARITEMKKGARIWTAFTGDIDMSRVGEKQANLRR